MQISTVLLQLCECTITRRLRHLFCFFVPCNFSYLDPHATLCKLYSRAYIWNLELKRFFSCYIPTYCLVIHNYTRLDGGFFLLLSHHTHLGWWKSTISATSHRRRHIRMLNYNDKHLYQASFGAVLTCLDFGYLFCFSWIKMDILTQFWIFLWLQ